MEAGTQNEEEKKSKMKQTGWQKFVTFLAYGGFLIVIIVIALIAIFISYLTK